MTATRSVRLLLAVLAATAVAVLTLGPRRLIAPARGLFLEAMDAVTGPLLVWIPYGEAERVLNTLLFVPLGATTALLLSRRLRPLAPFTCFVVSAAVEYAQGSIPGRVPDPDDVLWNTLGGAMGVLVVMMVRALAGVAQRPRQSRRQPAGS